MSELLEKLQATYPNLHFKIANGFWWSPSTQTVHHGAITKEQDSWSLLHEVAHGVLQHTDFQWDIELIRLELDAWLEAKRIAKSFSITINDDHIEHCMDSYRDWLHLRSTCPTCGIVSLQEVPRKYHCINCNGRWSVTNARLCRIHRRSIKPTPIKNT